MPSTIPNSSMRTQNSSIDLITKILNANIDQNPYTDSRYSYMWNTNDASLGDGYWVAGGDVDGLSRDLDMIYEEQGELIPLVECRDAAGRVWIGFHGDANPKSRRYAMILTYALEGHHNWAMWEAGLAELKGKTVAAVGKASRSTKKETPAPAAAQLTTATTTETLTPGMTGRVTAQHAEAEDLDSAVDRSPIDADQGCLEDAVGGEWMSVELEVEEDEGDWIEV